MKQDTSNDPRVVLRSLLSGTSIALLGGAHDALSAKIVENEQFDGVWASSFGISLASRCMPDVDLLTMTESLDITRNMVAAVDDVPVVADCNAGYGNAINVMRMVRDFESAGVAGIAIEDNLYPKRCSLYENCERQLVSLEDMVGKIQAAKAVQRDPNFVLIARTEALIADEGVQAALERAAAYAEAGADALLIHAKAFPLLEDFTQKWQGDCPLVVVPTLFSDVSLSELEARGFRLGIFANQAVRAAIRAMRIALRSMRLDGTASTVEDQIEPLSEVNRLVDLDAVRQAEVDFVSFRTKR